MDHTLPEARIREGQLLREAMAGDRRAFGELYQIHLDGIYRYIYLQIGNEAEAEGLAEKTFERVWSLLADYTAGAAAFEAWLYWIARKVLINRKRREELPAPVGSPEADGEQAASVAVAPEKEELIGALSILSEMEKQVVLLRLVEDLSYRQVSQVLRRSEGACQLMQQWAMNALHHHLLSQRQLPRLQGWPEGREEVLSMCMEQMVPGHLTLEECVSMFPRWETEIRGLVPLVGVFHRAQAVHPDDYFVVSSRHRLERQLPPRPKPRQVEKKNGSNGAVAAPPQNRRIWSLVLVVVALLVVMSLVTGVGVVRAADASAPGDLLYGLDRMLEERALARVTNPTVATLQHLHNAQERIEEMETLAARGDDAGVRTALAAYGVEIGTLLGTGKAGPGDEVAVTQVIDDALVAQGIRLDAVLVPDADLGMAIAMVSGCAPERQLQLRPATRTVAQVFGTPEGEVAAWRCAGHNFGDIIIALETNRRTTVPVQRLLDHREFSAGWGHVWQAVEDAPAGQIGEPPGQTGKPPGQVGDPPGQSGARPVQGGEPPGQTGQPPGQAGEPPGQSGQPPGQAHEPPGQTKNPQGQDKEPPPGQVKDPPGQQQDPPGQVNEPPGQQQEPPGQQELAPDQGAPSQGPVQTAPGQENSPPGQENNGPPEKKNSPPGKNGK